jgi:NAD(P)-dependent dehydrogenase (short-subunit alcohol dehydrogenase family)
MRVVITGITGSLGAALGSFYLDRGATVLGVGRKANAGLDVCSQPVANDQRTREDAKRLLDLDPDLVLLSAGQIEAEVGRGGLPLPEVADSIHTINALFPQWVALEAAERTWDHDVDVVAIGSIADGSPSVFGPVYHASKAALHHFVTGTGPIIHAANPRVRLRLYRPGVIRGPLSWSPMVRLNERGRTIRAKRCEGAPRADTVAARVVQFVDGRRWVGSDREPLSFRFLKHLWGAAPELYYRLQVQAWKRGSRFAAGE